MLLSKSLKRRGCVNMFTVINSLKLPRYRISQKNKLTGNVSFNIWVSTFKQETSFIGTLEETPTVATRPTSHTASDCVNIRLFLPQCSSFSLSLLPFQHATCSYHQIVCVWWCCSVVLYAFCAAEGKQKHRSTATTRTRLLH